jgi:hypothetical protein
MLLFGRRLFGLVKKAILADSVAVQSCRYAVAAAASRSAARIATAFVPEVETLRRYLRAWCLAIDGPGLRR